MVDELIHPVVPGMHGYLIMSSCLSVLGLCIAYSVETLSRRFIKSIYLKADGQTLLINFHSAFTVSLS